MLSWVQGVHWHVYVIAAILLALFAYFIIGFVRPARTVRARIDRILAGLDSAGTDDVAWTGVIEREDSVLHLWREFRETLHEVRVVNPRTGIDETLALRATVPAEVFFTEQALVDQPLRAEFFKHLPGIFTGIGIIGTFSGLLLGLSKFKVSDDANQARTSLETLLGAVTEAFVVSALAIGLAMVVTFIEKQLLVGLYGRVRKLTQAIDERFKAGVGEEYLARLVGASEQSATHSAQLKDALVGELKQILIEVTERQIAAYSASQQQLGQHIGHSVATTLEQPLRELADVARQVSGSQSQAVQSLLTDVLTQFSTRLEGMLGGQLAGIQQMQHETIGALREAVGQLKQMSATVEGAGQRASETLMERLNETLHKLDQRQLVMTEEMRKFVQEIRTLIGQTNLETQEQTRQLLEKVAAHVGAVVGDLSAGSRDAVGAMGTQVESLSGKVGEVVAQMAATVARLEAVSTDAIGRMNAGAETLALAADEFARAGQGVTGVLGQSQALAGQLTQSSQALTGASSSLESMLGDYRNARDTVAQMVAALQVVVESARREAALTSDVLQRLEASAAKLAVAQTEADAYLAKVNEVLGTTHESFAKAMSQTLDRSTLEFMNKLSSATKMLRETIEELDGTLASVAPRAAAGGRSR